MDPNDGKVYPFDKMDAEQRLRAIPVPKKHEIFAAFAFASVIPLSRAGTPSAMRWAREAQLAFRKKNKNRAKNKAARKARRLNR